VKKLKQFISTIKSDYDLDKSVCFEQSPIVNRKILEDTLDSRTKSNITNINEMNETVE